MNFVPPKSPQWGSDGSPLHSHKLLGKTEFSAMKAYKFKLKINQRFQTNCQQTLNICRELYNAALQERREAFRVQKISVNFHRQAIQLPEIKLIRDDVEAVYSQVLQDTLR